MLSGSSKKTTRIFWCYPILPFQAQRELENCRIGEYRENKLHFIKILNAGLNQFNRPEVFKAVQDLKTNDMPFANNLLERRGPHSITEEVMKECVYLYDGSNSVVEMDASGTPLARYTQGSGIDEPVAELRGGIAGYYQQDGLGSVTSITGIAGTLLNSDTYDAFGNATASAGSFGNSLRYTDRDFDSETGLYYYRARYYDASTGRFDSEDPSGFGGGHDFYTYTGNKPISFTDPTGLKPCPLDPKSRCAKLFQKVLGITPSKFNKDMELIPWFYSPNINTFDPLTWNDLARKGDNDLISKIFTGTSVEAATASPGGMVPAPVVLGPDWFFDTPDRQNAVMQHEAVHSITGQTDAWIFSHFKPYGLPDSDFHQFGNTDAFTRWLLKGCPQKGVSTIPPLSKLK